MWTLSEIEELNAADPGQKKTILQHLLSMGAAWPGLLCDSASNLEDYGPPHVCAFAQLPFPVTLEPGVYRLPALTKNVSFDVDFTLLSVSLNEKSEIKVQPIESEVSPLSEACIATQLRMFVRLWDRRAVYYKNYFASLTDSGPKRAIINPRTSKWAPDYGAYTGEIVTSLTFESNLAERMQAEITALVAKFLAQYTIVAHLELPLISKPYGFFLMTAPGRVAYSSPPDPIISGILRSTLVSPSMRIQKSRLLDAYNFSFREFDRYLKQLFAMQRLAREGEPELALVGSVTAIEWYMNSFLPPMAKQRSISVCLKEDLFKGLSQSLRASLREAVEWRNATVHGSPPARHKRPSPADFSKTVDKVSAIIDVGIYLYREMNSRLATEAKRLAYARR